MNVISIVALIAILSLGLVASVSDVRTERVPNRILVVAIIAAIALAVIQYGLLLPDLLNIYAVNVLATSAIALVLFFTHTWAGGDCKLACVLAVLYPAQAYVVFNERAFSLPLAVGLAFVSGALYLLVSYVLSLLREQSVFSPKAAKAAILPFVQAYICALSCVGALRLINAWLVAPYIQMGTLAMAAISFCVLWLLANAGLLRSKALLCGLLLFDALLAFALRTSPFGDGPYRYLFVLAVLIIRAVVSQYNYQIIPTAEVREGTILSTATSLLFVGSKVKGLPAISTEDLRSRLTEAEAASVRRWGKTARGSDSIQVVRKMPFAMFVTSGYILYFVLWSVV